jgi:hypothetical protein
VLVVTKGIGCNGFSASDRNILIYDEGFVSGILRSILKAYPDTTLSLASVSGERQG